MFFSFCVESFQEARRCHVTCKGDKSLWIPFYEILLFFDLPDIPPYMSVKMSCNILVLFKTCFP